MESHYLKILLTRDIIEKGLFNDIFTDYNQLSKKYKQLQFEYDKIKHLKYITQSNNKSESNQNPSDGTSNSNQANSNNNQDEKERQLIRDLNEQYQVNQEQSKEILKFSKQMKQYETEINDLNKQLVMQIQAKLESQKALDNMQFAFHEMNSKFTVMSQEYHATKDTNIFLEKKVRTLTADNQMLIQQLMDIKEKQIDKLDQANELYKEVAKMKEQLQIYKHPPEVIKQLHDIMEAEPSLRAELIKTASKMKIQVKREDPKKNKNGKTNDKMGTDEMDEEEKTKLEDAIITRSLASMPNAKIGFSRILGGSSLGTGNDSSKSMYNKEPMPFEALLNYDSIPNRVEARQHAHEKETTCMRFSGQGNLLATGGADNTIKIWDVAQNMLDCVQTFKIFSKPVCTLAFGKDGELIAGCSVDRQIKICSLRPHKINHSLSGHSDHINCCGFCSSVPYLLTGSTDRTIKIWDYLTGQSTGGLGCASGVQSLDVSVTDSIVASGHIDGRLRIWSIRDQKLLHEVKDIHDEKITSVNYLPDGCKILTNSKDHTLKLIDIRMFGVLKTIESEDYYNSTDTNQIGISPTGKYASLGSKSGKLIILNLDEGEVEEIYDREHTSAIISCDWSKKGGSKVATVDAIGNLFIWE